MLLQYPHNVRIPVGNDIIIFRNRVDGYRYYKKSDGSVIRLSNQVSGDVYLLAEHITGQIFNSTDERLDIFITDKGTGIAFYSNQNKTTLGVSGAVSGRGGRGPQGFQGASGSGSSSSGFQILTDAPTVVWDVNQGGFAEVTLNGDRTLNILNAEAGASYAIRTIQGGAGGFVLNVTNSVVVNDGQGELLFSAEPDAEDIFSVIYDGTKYSWNYGLFYS